MCCVDWRSVAMVDGCVDRCLLAGTSTNAAAAVAQTAIMQAQAAKSLISASPTVTVSGPSAVCRLASVCVSGCVCWWHLSISSATVCCSRFSGYFLCVWGRLLLSLVFLCTCCCADTVETVWHCVSAIHAVVYGCDFVNL